MPIGNWLLSPIPVIDLAIQLASLVSRSFLAWCVLAALNANPRNCS